jgi:hypothetical protein
MHHARPRAASGHSGHAPHRPATKSGVGIDESRETRPASGPCTSILPKCRHIDHADGIAAPCCTSRSQDSRHLRFPRLRGKYDWADTTAPPRSSAPPGRAIAWCDVVRNRCGAKPSRPAPGPHRGNRHRHIGRPERRHAGLGNPPPGRIGQHRQRRDVRILPLIRRHPLRRVALHVLDRPEALLRGQLHILRRHVIGKVQPRPARSPRPATTPRPGKADPPPPAFPDLRHLPAPGRSTAPQGRPRNPVREAPGGRKHPPRRPGNHHPRHRAVLRHEGQYPLVSNGAARSCGRSGAPSDSIPPTSPDNPSGSRGIPPACSTCDGLKPPPPLGLPTTRPPVNTGKSPATRTPSLGIHHAATVTPASARSRAVRCASSLLPKTTTSLPGAPPSGSDRP